MLTQAAKLNAHARSVMEANHFPILDTFELTRHVDPAHNTDGTHWDAYVWSLLTSPYITCTTSTCPSSTIATTCASFFINSQHDHQIPRTPSFVTTTIIVAVMALACFSDTSHSSTP